ncbi:MAG: DoxX family protein [Thermoleophilaceae bacterium]
MSDLPTLTSKPSARILGVAFTLAGLLHFIRPAPYEAIMPPFLPAPRELVLLSGAAESAGGIATLFPKAHPFARWWLIAVLVAVFPANVYMALNPDDIKGLPDIPTWTLWARLPLQLAFIAWVVRATRPPE